MMYYAIIGPMRAGGSIDGGKSHGGFKNKYVTLIFESWGIAYIHFLKARHMD